VKIKVRPQLVCLQVPVLLQVIHLHVFEGPSFRSSTPISVKTVAGELFVQHLMYGQTFTFMQAGAVPHTDVDAEYGITACMILSLRSSTWVGGCRQPIAIVFAVLMVSDDCALPVRVALVTSWHCVLSY
jgi:hypothetical protein